MYAAREGSRYRPTVSYATSSPSLRQVESGHSLLSPPPPLSLSLSLQPDTRLLRLLPRPRQDALAVQTKDPPGPIRLHPTHHPTQALKMLPPGLAFCWGGGGLQHFSDPVPPTVGGTQHDLACNFFPLLFFSLMFFNTQIGLVCTSEDKDY